MSTTGIATKKSHDNDTTASANINAAHGASSTPTITVNKTLRRIVSAQGSGGMSCGHAARRQTAVSSAAEHDEREQFERQPDPALVVDDDPAQVVEHAERRRRRDLSGESERRRRRERIDQERFDHSRGRADDDETPVAAQPLAHHRLILRAAAEPGARVSGRGELLLHAAVGEARDEVGGALEDRPDPDDRDEQQHRAVGVADGPRTQPDAR